MRAEIPQDATTGTQCQQRQVRNQMLLNFVTGAGAVHVTMAEATIAAAGTTTVHQVAEKMDDMTLGGIKKGSSSTAGKLRTKKQHRLTASQQTKALLLPQTQHQRSQKQQGSALCSKLALPEELTFHPSDFDRLHCFCTSEFHMLICHPQWQQLECQPIATVTYIGNVLTVSDLSSRCGKRISAANAAELVVL